MTVTELAKVKAWIDDLSGRVTALELAVRGLSSPHPRPASALAIVTAPAGATNHIVFLTQPVVRFTDDFGNTVANMTWPVTVTITSGSGTLFGTTTVVPVLGVTTFSGLGIDGSGNHTLTFSVASAAVVASVSVTLAVFSPPVSVNVTPGVASVQATGLAPTVPYQMLPGVASVTATGLAPTVVTTSRIAVGMATVVVTGFAPTVVAAGPAWPNEPVGAVVLQDAVWQTPPTQADGAYPGMTGWYAQNALGRGSLITDATAPLSPNNVLQAYFPIGYVEGQDGAAITAYYTHTVALGVYIGFWVKVLSPYQFSNSGSQKLCDCVWNDATSSHLNFELWNGGPISTAEFAILPTGWPTGGTAPPSGIYHAGAASNGTKTDPAFDTWFRIEIACHYATTSSSSDGTLKWWVTQGAGGTPVQQGNLTNVQTPNNPGADLVKVYNGQGGSATHTIANYIVYDHFRYSHF